LASTLAIEDFGSRIATVWSELRPATRGLVERALQAALGAVQPTRNFQYDARADIELSRFLTVLDDRVGEKIDALILRQLARSDQLPTLVHLCCSKRQSQQKYLLSW
jgi:hypothetical protein